MVVPVDKNDVGYRELPETDGNVFLTCIVCVCECACLYVGQVSLMLISGEYVCLWRDCDKEPGVRASNARIDTGL